MNINKNLAIAIAAGILTFATSAWQSPEELREAIHDSVIVACALIQTFDDKQDPPDQDPPDDEGKPQ